MPISQPFSGAKRVPYVQACELDDGSSRVEGAIRNISVLGVYLGVDPIPKVGEKLRLRFELPGGSVEVEAEVAWRNTSQRHKVASLPAGCGLRFLGLGQRDRSRIEELVRSFGPKPG
jgi:PilZ domain